MSLALPLNLNRTDIMDGKSRLIVTVMSCLIIYSQMLSGCAAPPRKTKPVSYPAKISTEAISDEIAGTEKILSQFSGNQTDGLEKSALLLRLAMLYAHSDNPNRNYLQAIDYLKQYAAFGEPVDAAFALSLLTRLSDAVIAGEAACDKLTVMNEKLEEKNRELSRENLQLKQIIEKLKHLDIQLEKKRKSFD